MLAPLVRSAAGHLCCHRRVIPRSGSLSPSSASYETASMTMPNPPVIPAERFENAASRFFAGMFAVVMLVGIVMPATVTARSGAGRSCGAIRINYSPTPGEHYTKMYISAPRSISCPKARGLMRRYRDGDGRGALRCGGSSVVCVYPDKWTCDAVTPGQWPVIQECYRHRNRIVGRVKSKIKGPR
jgi:hypothetical protein